MSAGDMVRGLGPDDLLDRLRDRTAAFAQGEFHAQKYAVRRLVWIALLPTVVSTLALVLAIYAVSLSLTVAQIQAQISAASGMRNDGTRLADQSWPANTVSEIDVSPTDRLPQVGDLGQLNTSATASLEAPDQIRADEPAAVDRAAPDNLDLAQEPLRSPALRSKPEGSATREYMAPERRFVLADFNCPTGDGVRRYEAGRSYPMPSGVAHAAARRDLVAHHRPLRWTPPSILTPPEILTEAEVTVAEAELQAFERHAADTAKSVPED